MVMRFDSELKIEDPRGHTKESVDTLRRLLAGGAYVATDPKRLGFYEVESESEVYYIHISPVSRKIVLLAVWPLEEVDEETRLCGVL